MEKVNNCPYYADMLDYCMINGGECNNSHCNVNCYVFIKHNDEAKKIKFMRKFVSSITNIILSPIYLPIGLCIQIKKKYFYEME